MIIQGFTNGYPTVPGLYVFQDFEGNIYPTVLLVYKRRGRWRWQKPDESYGDLRQWYDEKNIVGYHLVTRN